MRSTSPELTPCAAPGSMRRTPRRRPQLRGRTALLEALALMRLMQLSPRTQASALCKGESNSLHAGLTFEVIPWASLN